MESNTNTQLKMSARRRNSSVDNLLDNASFIDSIAIEARNRAYRDSLQ
jgi:hypothetical protein